MPYDPLAIANYFIELAASRNVRISPMKLQKLVYFANGWNLAIKGKPLIDEQVEAWTFGPVIRTLYQQFRDYGGRDIDDMGRKCETIRLPGGNYDVEVVEPRVADTSEDAEFTRALLNKVWEIYGGYTAIQLSNMTHKEGSPWKKVFDDYDGKLPKGTDIPPHEMRTYFADLARTGRRV